MALAWGDGAWGDNAWGGGETFPVSVTETIALAESQAVGFLIDVSITESLTGGTSWLDYYCPSHYLSPLESGSPFSQKKLSQAEANYGGH
jgi:hypothetical protein